MADRISAMARKWSWAAAWGWMAILSILVVLTISRVQAESKTRADQNCKIFETQHLATVERLRNTYKYLLALTPDERALAASGHGNQLNILVMRNLKQTEAEAKIDPAPIYCDKPGVGLPEPDPVVPKRPPELR